MQFAKEPAGLAHTNAVIADVGEALQARTTAAAGEAETEHTAAAAAASQAEERQAAFLMLVTSHRSMHACMHLSAQPN